MQVAMVGPVVTDVRRLDGHVVSQRRQAQQPRRVGRPPEPSHILAKSDLQREEETSPKEDDAELHDLRKLCPSHTQIKKITERNRVLFTLQTKRGDN